MKIIFAIGTRPNIVKIAPLIKAIKKRRVEWRLVHTGQHYHDRMSEVFLRDLDVPLPNINLLAGSGTHANQVARIMTRFERYCLTENPDIVVVVGDVNSTLACALVVSKLDGVKLAHVEAGCRTFDGSPEETNRRLTDMISDYLFCPSESDCRNLIHEGIEALQCHIVGDVAIDSLVHTLPRLNPLIKKPHALLTLHRPANVDDPARLQRILETIIKVAQEIDIIFPIHPRTMDRIKTFGYGDYLKYLSTYPTIGYRKCLGLLMNAKFLMTDSGGLEIESSYLNVPCLTLRTATGHPSTVLSGTNTLVGLDGDKLIEEVHKILEGRGKFMAEKPELWDGKTAERIVSVLLGA